MQLTMEEIYVRTVLDQARQEVDESLKSLRAFKKSVLLLSKQRPESLLSEEKLEAELQEDMDVLKDFKNKLDVPVGRHNITISVGELEAIEAAARNMVEKWEMKEIMLKAEEVLLQEDFQEAEKLFLEAEKTLKKAQKAWDDAEAAWHAAAFELAEPKILESDDENLSLQQETKETEAESQLAKLIT
ncbi:hypothetical protein BOTCAL_0384g00130 [Botryotinia calthae]|uniref:Uncharacterized protein n=1 Tax=Botryotinia calthae TaxID=38488 RepID=A0A4Y8CU21_9HELO|nr:hypothetical protein BOTCAL_0384g00130 [Botryotinia calthae]